MTNEEMINILNESIEEISNAYKYWHEKGYTSELVYEARKRGTWELYNDLIYKLKGTE